MFDNGNDCAMGVFSLSFSIWMNDILSATRVERVGLQHDDSKNGHKLNQKKNFESLKMTKQNPHICLRRNATRVYVVFCTEQQRALRKNRTTLHVWCLLVVCVVWKNGGKREVYHNFEKAHVA